MNRQRILILGGGFGGVYAAMRLERRLRRRDDVELSLVSRDNYLVFQPLIPEVVSSSVGLVDTIAPPRRLCPRTQLYTREIDAIDIPAGTVTLRPGVRPRPLVLEFDHLVIALGNVPALGALPGVREHAMPFKSLGDALHIRNHVLNVLEEAAIEPDRDARRALMTFVVAGGGFSGVELGAELNDFVREVVRDDRDRRWRTDRVLVLRARTASVAGPAVGRGTSVRVQAVRYRRLAALANGVSDETARARPKAARGDRLGARP
ncbi:MAG: FAD-dependent oxidoreductase, partial [Acidobacteria bacterium]|nr:FAD-dependent oxidoreductase [Acidobacteriota bacterium]